MHARRLLGLVLLVLGVAVVAPPPAQAEDPAAPAVPADSGAGRRVVYLIGQQRVWLVAETPEGEKVERTYLVSGRKGYPKAGTYRVFSTSRHTRSGSLRMEYMVRFTKSKRTNVGFHSIPVNRRGAPIQSEADLGRPRSRGCVRQRVADAASLWNFAPIGTVVVVTP